MLSDIVITGIIKGKDLNKNDFLSRFNQLLLENNAEFSGEIYCNEYTEAEIVE